MPLELFVTVTDLDLLGTTAVDEFNIPIIDEDNTDSMFGPPTTYSGTCGTGTTLDVSIRVTTDMDPSDMDPPDMDPPDMDPPDMDPPDMDPPDMDPPDMDPSDMSPSAVSTNRASSFFLRSVAFTLAVGAVAGATIFAT